MSKLMISVSGIRGIYGKDLLPENVVKIAALFGEFLGKGTVIIGRDSRTSGSAMSSCIKAGLTSIGCSVIDLGIVSTPTVLLKVQHSRACGGISITASHNPAQWNAMKFVDSNGLFLYPEKAKKFVDSLTKKPNYTTWENIGLVTYDNTADDFHIKKILALSCIDVKKIKSSHFRVALDTVNGAGGRICTKLLTELGCTISPLNTQATGHFAHEPEPLPHNLTDLQKLVALGNIDIGFATDPDVDRLAIIDEFGKPIGEEFTLLLAEDFILSKTKGDIVTNISSSMSNEDMALKYGVKVFRQKVGEINVGSKMQEINSPIGGEGNGGVICSELHYTRDAIMGIALILGFMAEKNQSISKLASQIPKYYFAKEKIVTDSKNLDIFMEVAKKLAKDKSFFQDGKSVDSRDGIKIIGKKKWVHIRKSGTEPIIRVYAEAQSSEIAKTICQNVIKYITKNKDVKI